MRPAVTQHVAALALALTTMGCDRSSAQSDAAAGSIPAQATTHAWTVPQGSTGFVGVRFGSTELGHADTLMSELPSLVQALGTQCRGAFPQAMADQHRFGTLGVGIEVDPNPKPARALKVDVHDLNAHADEQPSAALRDCVETGLRAHLFTTAHQTRAEIYLELDYKHG